MMKPCTHCGEPFRPKYPSQKLCYPCWLDRENAFQRVGELEREIEQLRDGIADRPHSTAEMQWTIERLKADLTAQRAISDLWKAIASQPVKSEPAIPGEMRRLLVLLCHPDKHGNSQAATKATTWLLALPKDGTHG